MNFNQYYMARHSWFVVLIDVSIFILKIVLFIGPSLEMKAQKSLACQQQESSRHYSDTISWINVRIISDFYDILDPLSYSVLQKYVYCV